MTNRLRIFLRATSFCAGLLFLAVPTVWLKAQPSFFDFSYNGPTTLPVGPTCSSMLQGNVPDPVVSSTIGANITMSMFDPVASMFLYTDLFTSGTAAHVYWFVKDDAGHSYTYEYFINFVDVSPPVFNLTGVFDTLEFSSIVAVPPAPNIPVVDNCTGVINKTFNETPGPDTCESGMFTRTWTATDANNNTATFTQTIIIYKDTLPPGITGYPQDGSASCVQLSTAYPAWRALQLANFSATDPSGIFALLTNAPQTFPAGCKVPLTVKFTAIDNCQILQNVFVTFSTSDNQGPVIVKPPKDTVAYCSQSDNELAKLREWISTKAYSQALDSCSAPLMYSMKIGNNTVDSAQVIAAFLASFAGGCSADTIGSQIFPKVHGFVSVDFFVKDACGNTTPMGNADFGAIDTLPPVITGVNKTEQCGGGNDQTVLQAWINAHGNAVVTEDCSNFSWTNFSFTTSTGQSGSGNFNTGPYPTVQANNCTWFTIVTFRATDDCGNSNTLSLRFTIEDTLVPSFAGLQPNITVYCPNPLPTVPAATVSDNCDANVSITFSRVYKDSLCAGSYKVETTWTATDDCDNSASALQIIFVRDTTRPVFILIPPNRTFRCDTFVLPPVPVMGVDIMASDGCSPVVSITTSTQSFQSADPDSCAHYAYDIIRTFTATDECGNSSTATQTISVIDNLGPVPGGILDTTALCSALMPFPAPQPIATDACSGLTAPPTYMGQTPMPGTCTDQYTLSLHWVAKDVCGNPTSFDQLLHVIDTVAPSLINIPPNVTVECNAIPTPPNTATFNATDNCDNSVTVTLVETEIRNPDTDSCAHWTDYIVKREWTATDNCGNSQTYTQLIQIEDTTPPVIVPPSAMIFPNDIGDCSANILIPPPLSVTDICSDQNFSVLLKDTTIMSVPPGSPSGTPVDTVVLQLFAPNLPPFQPVVGNATLTIFLDQVDGEGMQEYLKVFGENGPSLGNTASTITQCASSSKTFTIPASQLNDWLSDGKLILKLAPNGAMNLAINISACPFNQGYLNRVRANLAYTYSNSDVPIALTFTLDGGASQNYPPPGQTFLTEGTHTVIYTATDCAGNSSTASAQITVNDTQPPSLTAPANITAYTGQNDCESTVALPFPGITENCAMSANLSLSSNVLPLFFEFNPDFGIVPSVSSPTLSGIIPNAVGQGTLKIRHKGDNAQAGEIFNVYDEGGIYVGSTGPGTMLGECLTFFEYSIPVTDVQINDWATVGGALGTTSFFLEPSLVSNADFISNCAALLPNGTDGMSQVQVILEYSYAVVNYAIKNSTNQTVSSGTLTGSTTTDTLPPANYTVMYTTTDHAGLSAMTSYALTVRDSVKPKAICQPTYIFQMSPSGGIPDTLKPFQINNGSYDNCTPTSNLLYSVSPNVFDCHQAGTSVNVTLTVTDTSGNFATCKTIVGLKNKPPSPAYTPVCENGILQLFANPPSASPFDYVWSGPSNYFSDTINPVVNPNAMANNNGTYCVTITGATGCTSSSCVVVALAILSNTPELEIVPLSYCPGQTIQLKTESYSGQNVKYQWMVDSIPALPGGPILLDTTLTPLLNINNAPPGNYVYYVKVFANGCNTAFSTPQMVTVYPTPPAAVDPSLIHLCEGQSLTLHSTTPSYGGTLTYMWTGPSGFMDASQSPLVTPSAVKAQHEGVYTLITKRNGCVSNPVTVTVSIDNKPGKPSLSGNPILCEGQTLTLVCNNLNAAQYVWTLPNGNTIITTTNSLTINNVTTANTGNYTVLVFNGCFSDESSPFYVDIQAYPIVSASSNAPICQGANLNLMASFSSASPLNWFWTGPLSPDIISNSQNPVIPNGASGTYQVIGKTSFGCADTATVDVLNVTPPVITYIGNITPPCCNGSAALLLDTVVTAYGPLTYQWAGPGTPPFSSTDANPSIGNVCLDDIGQYTLVATDAFGCPSAPASTAINIQEPPPAPVLSVTPNATVCAGTNLTLTINNPSGGTYLWNRPGNLSDTVTTSFKLEIPNSQTWHSGVYTVIAISANGTCQSGLSNPVTLTVNPIPPTPTINTNAPVCEGQVLMLFGNTGGFNGASFAWTGPAAFTDTLQNPLRQPVTLNMEGEYKLKLTKNGCSSPFAFVFVDVIPTPEKPTIADPPAGICMDGPVTSFLNITNPVNGMEYTWEDANSSIILQGPSTATNLNLGLPNVLALGPGVHMFRVIARTANSQHCKSDYSNVVSVSFDTIPAGVNAFAGQDHPACAAQPIQLSGSPDPLPGTVKGFWTQIPVDTVDIDNASATNTYFHGVAGNVYTFQWSLSNGVCMNFSSDTVSIIAQNPEQAYGGNDTFVCDISGIRLHATQGISTQGKWTQSSSQVGLGIVIDEMNDPNTSISGNLQRGQNYVFTWEIGNLGCGISKQDVTVFIYNGKPIAGSDKFVCSNNNCTQLEASAIRYFETGKWESPDPGLSFNLTSPNTADVCGLKPGKNIIYRIINNDACGADSRDTLEVTYEIFPTAVDDVVNVAFGNTAEFNVLTNDILPTTVPVELIITSPPGKGTVDSLGGGEYIYRPQSGFSGTETMIYRIRNPKCLDAISFGTVTFNVGAAADCFIPTIITPNGDGFNDVFTIPTVCTIGEGEANLEVSIFNQWGDLVFHELPYQNNWGGTYNNEELPAGTYYFVVRLNEKDKPKTGFLLIQR